MRRREAQRLLGYLTLACLVVVFADGCGGRSAAIKTTASPPTTIGTSTESTSTAATTIAIQPRELPIGKPIPGLPRSPEEKLFEKLRRELFRGNLAFTTPTTLDRNETAEIALAVGLGSVSSVTSALGQTEGVKVHARVQLADNMEALLTGLGFQIQAETPTIQSVGVTQTTDWRWQIQPTRTGRLHVHLTLAGLLSGAHEAVTIRTFERTLVIKVTLGERVSSFFDSNWHWLFTAILVPAVAWFWRRRRTKPDSSPPAASSP